MCGHLGSALGWARDRPDFRDYTPDHPVVAKMLQGLPRAAAAQSPPPETDLREYFFEEVGRESLPLCTAQACVLLAEYFEARSQGKLVVRSPLFLYQMARRLSEPYGHTGTDIRTTLKALARFGVPPEDYYPSEPGRFDSNPDSCVAMLGRRFPPICYFRLDRCQPSAKNPRGANTVETLRAFLAAGFPLLFGFSVPSSALIEADQTDIPYRVAFDSVRGGQAAAAVGYDDRRLTSSRGALLIYSPLGTAWSRPGHYWLPYRYVEEQLAVDFWTMLHQDWLQSEEFQRPMGLEGFPG